MITKQKESAEKAIRDIRRATRRQYSAEEKIVIVLEGLLMTQSGHCGQPLQATQIHCIRLSLPPRCRF